MVFGHEKDPNLVAISLRQNRRCLASLSLKVFNREKKTNNKGRGQGWMQLTSERAREMCIERVRELEIDWLLLRQCGKSLSLWPVQAPHPVTMFWGRGPTKVFWCGCPQRHRPPHWQRALLCRLTLGAMTQKKQVTHYSISLDITDRSCLNNRLII